MKSFKLFIVFFFWLHVGIYAQEVYKNFGAISPDEYQLTSHPLDPDAEAIVLYDIGRSHFFYDTEKGFEIIYERATRIKIFSEAGLKWAEIQIPFYQQDNIYEQIYDLEAISYVFDDGKVTKIPLDIKNTYTEKVNKYWNTRKFALPNIKPGSIIEYRYKINSQYLLQPRDWYFQWKIPVLYSEYTTAMTPFYEYTYILQGTKKEEIEITSRENRIDEKYLGNIKYTDIVHKFVRKNIPTFKSEDFISSVDDYIAKISFQLSKINRPSGGTEQVISTWEKLISDLSDHDNFGKFASRALKIADKVLNIEELKTKNETERFDYVLDYVKNNYLWNQNYGILATKTPAKLLEEKSGNAADINLLTTGLLNAVGIKSYPLIISTRANGKIKLDYPFLHFFNSVLILANINGRNIMSDATDRLAQNNRIPENCINDLGLVVDKEKTIWISTEPQIPSSITTDLSMEMQSPDNISVGLLKVLNDYDALRFKKMYADKKGNMKETFERENIKVNDSTLQLKDPEKRGRSQFYSYTCNYKPDFVNGKIYISPFLYETIMQNPLKEKERSYPVDFIFQKSERLHCKLMLPHGYKIDYIPENISIDDDLFQLEYTTNISDDIVLISLNYLLKKAIYMPEEYERLKYFLDELVKKTNEKIVLASNSNTQ